MQQKHQRLNFNRVVMKAKDFLSQEDKNAIVDAIKVAENRTSGEIRVHIENRCKIDCLDRSTALFDKMKMNKTALRNGVLIYLAVQDRKFSIIGDVGINLKVEDNFWDEIKDCAIECFKQEQFAKGICSAIAMSGEKLAKYFPVADDDINELSDDISFG